MPVFLLEVHFLPSRLLMVIKNNFCEKESSQTQGSEIILLLFEILFSMVRSQIAGKSFLFDPNS